MIIDFIVKWSESIFYNIIQHEEGFTIFCFLYKTIREKCFSWSYTITVTSPQYENNLKRDFYVIFAELHNNVKDLKERRYLMARNLSELYTKVSFLMIEVKCDLPNYSKNLDLSGNKNNFYLTDSSDDDLSLNLPKRK